MRTPYALRVAIKYWKNGFEAPVDIETDLLRMGFCLYTLRDRYYNG